MKRWCIVQDVIIKEQGLYKLLMISRKSVAKQFRIYEGRFNKKTYLMNIATHTEKGKQQMRYFRKNGLEGYLYYS
jgi:hypothetical protein